MRPIVYLFGKLKGGNYTQYPDDGTSGVLGSLYPLAKAPTQIIIRRDGTFIYYCYIRKLPKEQYIGFCVMLNGTYIIEIKKLFPLFEKRIEEMCERGTILCYDESGNVVPVVSYFHEESEEASLLVESMGKTFKPEKTLPPVDFSIGKDATNIFSVEDDLNDMVKSSYRFGYTCVYKQADYDTIRMNSYRSVLQRITDDNNSLKEANKKLQDEVAEVKRQKKQFKNVVILLLLVIGCGVGIYMLYNNLNATQSDLSATREHLDNANNEIVQKQYSLKTMSETIRTLQNSLSQEKSRCEEIEKTLSTKEDVLSKVESYMPIIITDVEIANVYNNGSYETGYGGSIYSSNTMYVKPRITYEGIKTGGNINLRIKLYTPTGLSRGSSSPSDCSWAESMDVDEGNNTHSFQGWGGASKGHWSSGTYRYEFWYGNVCLKAKTFTIY